MRLDPDEMADGPKAALLPCAHEALDPAPAVKAGTESIGFQNSVNFAEGWQKPTVVVVVGAPPSVARDVVHEIWWVGESKINAVVRDRTQNCDAITLSDAIQKRFDVVHRTFGDVRWKNCFSSDESKPLAD